MNGVIRFIETTTVVSVAMGCGFSGQSPAASPQSEPQGITAVAAAATARADGDASQRNERTAPAALPQLNLDPSVREACTAFQLPPDGYAFQGPKFEAEPRLSLGGLAECLTVGPLSGQQVQIVGSTDLPGVQEYPVDGGGAADVVRTVLAQQGVPVTQLATLPPNQPPALVLACEPVTLRLADLMG